MIYYLCFCYYDRYFCVHSVHEEKSSSPLSMTYNPTKFPCISNNKSYSSGVFFRLFFFLTLQSIWESLIREKRSRLKFRLSGYDKYIVARLSWYITTS